MSFTLDFDQHERPEHLPKIDIDDYYKTCLKAGVVPEENENWQVGTLDDFTIDSIDRFGKAFVHNGKVYIVDSISDLHNYASSIIAHHVLEQLWHKRLKFLIGTKSPVCIFNKFGGGVTLVKYPDAKIYDRLGHECNPIVVKSAFCDEKFDLLLEESISYLTEFTNNSYVIGFKVEYDPTFFKAVIFVLERRIPPNETKIQKLRQCIRNKGERLCDENCKQINLGDFEFAYYKNDLSKFGVHLFYKKEINDTNINEPIEFSLDVHKVTKRAHGCLNLKIPSEELCHIRDLWKKHFHLVPKYK
ncbi:unnamed protein product [Brachionus calyciflorus]|uniref:Uncharacterized protein n=1 Tax=Brachionus calyciflorus TaxID=104777 RepID=A0A813MDA0_9BILA|nr:unnamed protein product [Brachionus calyciflorus]